MVAKNHLIELLPRKDRLSMLAACQPIELESSAALYKAGTRTAHVYFPLNGFVSMLTMVDGMSLLGVGMVGHEGMVGVHVALGGYLSPFSAIVHGRGAALRIAVGSFRKELKRNLSLQRGLNRYVAVRMSQLASSSACGLYHQVGPRLARWLLMGQDRAESDQIFITQAFMSDILGVRRESVTAAAGLLQKDKLIEYSRGALRVLDRAGLEAAACSCYATDRTNYAHLID